jgi:hypothetical protein
MLKMNLDPISRLIFFKTPMLDERNTHLIPSFSGLFQQRSSRIILSFKESDQVPIVALFCREISKDLPCISFYCTCYINDLEKAAVEDKHRVHFGVLWSPKTTEAVLDNFRSVIKNKVGNLFSKPNHWEHFASTEPSFLIHCVAREYGDFVLSASDSLEDFHGRKGNNFLDAIHLVYNQLLLNHGNIEPIGNIKVYPAQLHSILHRV